MTRLLLLIFAFSMIISINVQADAGRETHGGDITEMRLLNMAWELFDQLSTLKKNERLDLRIDLSKMAQRLHSLKIFITDDVDLSGLPRDAINIPRENIWHFRSEAIDKLEQMSDMHNKWQFLLHEFLPLLDVDDSGYQHSRTIIKELKEESYNFSEKLREVIYVNSFDRGREGLSLEEVNTICNRQKNLNKDKYFAVYCIFHNKHWTETHIGFSSYTDYRYLGDAVNEISFATRRFRVHSYNSDPVYVPVQVPYQYEYEVDSNIFGLQVIGLGPVEFLQTKVLMDSSRPVSRYSVPLFFENERMAYRKCMNTVTSLDDNDLRYYKAKCEIYKDQENEYYFVITTNNPLI